METTRRQFMGLIAGSIAGTIIGKNNRKLIYAKDIEVRYPIPNITELKVNDVPVENIEDCVIFANDIKADTISVEKYNLIDEEKRVSKLWKEKIELLIKESNVSIEKCNLIDDLDEDEKLL